MTGEEQSLDLSDMPTLEGDEEEVKVEKGLKILTPNKLLTSFQYYQCKWLKTLRANQKMTQILYLLYQYNKITKSVSNNSIKSLQ